MANRRDRDSPVDMIRRGVLTPASRNERTELVWPRQDFEIGQKVHSRGANAFDRVTERQRTLLIHKSNIVFH